MQIFIDGQETSLERVTFNGGMNYGQFHDIPDQRIFTYEMIFARDEFLNDFSEQYEALLNEMRQIDADDEDPSEFAEIGYGPLSALLDDPRLLFDIVDDYFARDNIFPKVMPENSKQNWYFVINSVDQVVANESVSISGRCWRRQ